VRGRSRARLYGAQGSSTPPFEPLELPTQGYALARDPKRLDPLYARGWRSDRDLHPTTLWTDDYVNVLAPLARRLVTRWVRAS
jgi:hypothetical protein